jgi:iron complex outermembrane receptor protein
MAYSIKNYGTATALGALAITLAAPAFGQTADPQTRRPPPAGQDITTPATDTSKAEPDIVVTGSRIRGVTATGSTVISLDQKKIAEEPVNNTNDLLRRVPQVVSLGSNRAGGSAQNGAANANRGAGINLRGIGTSSTLLLYDGKRFPAQGPQGQYTDPSVLPSIALSRVEVVADGASAIYGSDAVAGVVNFILRKDFDGAEVRVRSGFTDDGSYDEQQVAAILGKKWDTGSAMIAGEYTRNPILFGADLDFYQDDNRYRGGRDLRTTNCNPSTITVGGGTYAIPAGGANAGNVGSLVRGTSNKCYYNGEDSVIPSQQRISVVGSVSQDVGSRLRLFADGFYSYRDGIILGTADTFTATVTNANPFFVTPVPGATSVTVPYSLLPELGPDYNPYHAYSWNASAGVEGKLFSDFKATIYYAHGESKDDTDRRLGVNPAALAAALADTNPATALNVFGGVNNPATLAKINDNFFQIVGISKLDVANLTVDGSLFKLPGGSVRIAVGGEYRNEYTFTDLATGNSAAQKHTTDAGSRNVKAVFAELYVPIFGASNAIPGFRELSLSLAGRYEKYSDFGDTSNPKIGLTWKPLGAVTLHASYGTSFRAPTFADVSTIAGGAGLYYDTLPGPNGNLTGIGIAGGNPSIKPETAKTWSAGVEIKPFRGLTATGTYFNIDYTNQIQSLRGTPGILTNPAYASFVTFNPTPAQVTALLNSGLPINAAINPAAVAFIVDGRRQNLGSSKVSGLDYGLNYNWTMGDWHLDAGVQGTYFISYKFQSVPGTPLLEVANTINFPQKFRVQGDVGVAIGALRSRVTVNHLSGYKNNSLVPAQHVSAYDTVDLFLGYDIGQHFTLSLDVRNLFNEDPPFVDIARGYGPQSSNPIPRLISVTAGVKF